MKFYKIIILTLLSAVMISDIQAQGPPITADKPIMLGSNSVIIKTLTEIRNTDEGTFTKVPFMFHYLPTSNTLIAVHVPLTTYSFDDEGLGRNGSSLGDINILGKYQFYRKDGKAKTFRMVVKTLQTLPTGKDFGPDEISAGVYQGYYGIVAGYESIKYGLSNEIGYNISPSGDQDEFRYKFGVGLPLLKPTYPVKQINLYFEYSSNWRMEKDAYEMLYAQGIQYAKGRLTLEAAVQVPLIQSNMEEFELNSNILLGTRYIF